jgi:hypothetical protein
MAEVYVYDASEKIGRCGREALMSFGEGDELRMMMMGLKRFTKIQPFNVKNARRAIAQNIIDENKYTF